MAQLSALLTQWLPSEKAATSGADQAPSIQAACAEAPVTKQEQRAPVDFDKTEWDSILALQQSGQSDIPARR